MDSNSPRTIDWLAIRAAYETSDEPVRIIAGLHGVSESMIDRRRVKEAWPRRRDTGRVAPRPPKADLVDWLAVRHEYETGEYSLEEVAMRHGCSLSRIYKQKDLEHWQARRPASPRAFGAGGKVTARSGSRPGSPKNLQHLQPGWALLKKLISAIR